MRDKLADVALWLYLKLLKGGEIMMAMLYATQIIAGKRTYAQTPALLKEQVAEILTDAGLENLIKE